MKNISLLGLIIVVGCMPIPAHYRTPPRTYTPRVERLSVTGFAREVFKQTSGGGSYASWGGHETATANAAASGWGTTAYGQASGRADWGGVAASHQWGGYYDTVTDVEDFKRELENTRCVSAVRLDPPDPGGTYNPDATSTSHT